MTKSIRSSSFALFAFVLVALSICVPLASAQQIIDGVAADGALYRFLLPNPWNGQLAVYAHGYVAVTEPLALPNNPLELAAFQSLTDQGFAVAMSSYSQNGWAVKEGVQDTHELQSLFSARVGTPVRTYLIGTSEGGLIAIDLAEKYPTKYDGALSVCGVVAGAPVNFQRIGDGRVVFDYFFPGVLPGDLLHMPNLDFSPGSPTYNAVLNALVAGLSAPGTPTLQYASVMKLPGSNADEIIYSALTVVGGYSAFNELLQRTSTGFSGYLQRSNQNNFYDNLATVYSGSADDAALNAKVKRYAADPAGVNYVTKYYAPTGQLHFPTVTIHTVADPTVPFSQEAQFKQVVDGAGASAFLVQQWVTRYGHCNFKPQEVENAFQGLFLWVNYGIKPAGGDVTIP